MDSDALDRPPQADPWRLVCTDCGSHTVIATTGRTTRRVYRCGRCGRRGPAYDKKTGAEVLP